jgi:hypothetical protein
MSILRKGQNKIMPVAKTKLITNVNGKAVCKEDENNEIALGSKII